MSMDSKQTRTESESDGNLTATEDLKENLEQYYSRIQNAVRVYTAGTGLDADDLTQETFLKAIRSISRFQQESGLYTWLYRIARNTCIDAMRKIKAGQGKSIHTEFVDETYESDQNRDELVSREELGLLEKAISRLPDDLRMLIVLKDLQNLRYHEISEIMGLNEGTVKSRLFRARLKLKQELLSLGYQP